MLIASKQNKSTETRQIRIIRIRTLKLYFQPNWQKNYTKLNRNRKQSTVKVDCQPDWHVPLRTPMVHICSQHCTRNSMKTIRCVYNYSTIENLPFYL